MFKPVITLSGTESSTVSSLKNRVVVQAPEDLSGTLDSTKEYFIDGKIDFTGSGIQIQVPAGGLTFAGYSFDTSELACHDDNYSLFVYPVGGSGNVLGKECAIRVTGANSKVYDLKGATGFEAIEVEKVNFNDCTSLGVIDNYRQGLETGTGRFGGTPELELKGAWLGGYYIETSIVRNLDDGNYSLFKAGAGFVMNSRFRSNQNMDLPTNASFVDFTPANFPNPSTIQFTGMIVTRNGTPDATDSNLTPNLLPSDLPCSWKGNSGIRNTFVGGRQIATAAQATSIAAGSTFYDLNATWTASGLQHFDAPTNGQLRHLGNNPIEFELVGELMLESSQNNVLELRWKKWDSQAGSFVYFGNVKRQVNALVGGRDVAFFTLINNVSLNKEDYIMLQVANNNGNNNVTAEVDSTFIVRER